MSNPIRAVISGALALLSLLIIGSMTSIAQDTIAFQRAEYLSGPGDTLRYRLFEPAGAGKKWLPLVLFLHGSGERGSDNAKQLTHGVMNFVSPEVQAKHPCYVLAPQCPGNRRWVVIDYFGKYRQADTLSKPLTRVMELVKDLVATKKIDPKRIYVTGLSMGGTATWDLITRYPDFFAAAVPVCGGMDTSTVCRVNHLPLWIFHGDNDDIVPPSYSRNAVKELKSCGGRPRYTEYPGMNHGCWDTAYADKGMMKWLFRQRKR